MHKVYRGNVDQTVDKGARFMTLQKETARSWHSLSMGVRHLTPVPCPCLCPPLGALHVSRSVGVLSRPLLTALHETQHFSLVTS